MPKSAKPKVTIYTDGACSGIGTPQARGGWAAILVHDDTGQAKEITGGERPTSNQKMEIRAVLEGLKALKEPCQVTVHAGSRFAWRWKAAVPCSTAVAFGALLFDRDRHAYGGRLWASGDEDRVRVARLEPRSGRACSSYH